MKTTRRNVLKGGGKAVAAAAVLPVVVKAALASEGEDSELLALWRRYQERFARITQLAKEEDRLFVNGTKAELAEADARVKQGWNEVTEIERQIAATPANTFAGLAVKLRIGTDNQPFRLYPDFQEDQLSADELNLMAALADAERLSGGVV